MVKFADRIHNVVDQWCDLGPWWTRRAMPMVSSPEHCDTQFLWQNQVLIVCMPKINCSTHTDKKCSQITKCYE
jgi:hypothetical protein